MDSFLRAIAVIVEVAILTGIIYALLNGVRLIAFDMGIKHKYNKSIIMALLAVGSIVVMFFIAHLTIFYPGID